jgi:peptidyl-prolyl cis-trans isomerase C
VIDIVRKPTRKEVDLYYKTHRSSFFAPERVHVLHIVKNICTESDRHDAQLVLERAERDLRAGMSFSEAADCYSDCSGNGGDLGWFTREVMVEEFEEVVFNLQPGQVSPIFETRFGLHIALLLEKRPAGIRPFSEVYDEVVDTLHRAKLEKIPK